MISAEEFPFHSSPLRGGSEVSAGAGWDQYHRHLRALQFREWLQSGDLERLMGGQRFGHQGWAWIFTVGHCGFIFFFLDILQCLFFFWSELLDCFIISLGLKQLCKQNPLRSLGRTTCNPF